MSNRETKEQMTDEIRTLKRIEELLVLIAKSMRSEQLEEILIDKKHRLLFEGAGQFPVTELSKKTGLSTATISRLWQKWEQMGLLVKDGKQYRRVL